MTMQSPSTEVILHVPDTSRNLTTYEPDDLSDYWLHFFDPAAALDEVVNHVKSLPGQRPGRESHTERAYRDGLSYVITWLGCPVERDLILPVGAWFSMPSRAKVRALIAHLYSERNLSASTVNSKYLAPLRHFLRALAGQTPMPDGANQYMLIGMIRDELRATLELKGPNKEVTSNEAPLWREGTRLSREQFVAVFRSIKVERGQDDPEDWEPSLDDVRDYALIRTAFLTGLRRAELAQISLDKITREGNVWLLRVVGKRNNQDPVTLPQEAYDAIMMWVDRYNAGLSDDDPRRIGREFTYTDPRTGKTEKRTVPVWQPLRRGGHMREVGERGFYPERGISPGSLGDIIKRRVESVIDNVTFSAHDARRTLAARLQREGALLHVIQRILRHKDSAVTLGYIGEAPDYESADAGKILWELLQ